MRLLLPVVSDVVQNAANRETDGHPDVYLGAVARKQAAPVDNEAYWNILEIIQSNSDEPLLHLLRFCVLLLAATTCEGLLSLLREELLILRRPRTRLDPGTANHEISDHQHKQEQ